MTQFANAYYVVLENQLSNCNMDAVDSTPDLQQLRYRQHGNR
jgi:hypothetical protein